MSDTMIQQMIATFRRAVADGKVPLRWEVNKAARKQLEFDHLKNVASLPETPEGHFMAPICGVPVARMPKNADEPMWTLFVEEEFRQS